MLNLDPFFPHPVNPNPFGDFDDNDSWWEDY